MSDRVVLITGALTGIGRAAAVIFTQEGAQIVVSGRRDKEGQALVAELQGLGAEAIFVRTDVRKDRGRTQPRGSNGQALRTPGHCGQQCSNRSARPAR